MEVDVDILTEYVRMNFDRNDVKIDETTITSIDKFSDLIPDKEYEKIDQRVPNRSNDKWNALLDCYYEPRKRTTEGILNGYNIVIKDCLAVKGLEMTCGTTKLDYVPTFDAAIVDHLLESGANLIGKSNMDPFAFGPTGEFSEFGPVQNPNYAQSVSGGSSSGSAAAVAAGLADIAIGTDTGGSIRVPAACCGLVGIKPSHGLVSRHGFVEMAPTSDTIGPITKDVETGAKVMDVITKTGSNVKKQNYASNLEMKDEIRVAIPIEFMNRMRETGKEKIKELEKLPKIDMSLISLDIEKIRLAYPQIISNEFVQMYKNDFVNRVSKRHYELEWKKSLENITLPVHVIERIISSIYLEEQSFGESYIASRKEALMFEKEISKIFERYDIIITPTLPKLPPKPNEYEDSQLTVTDVLGNTGPFSLVGNPAISIPWAEIKSKPLGIQLVASFGNDLKALKAAKYLLDNR